MRCIAASKPGHRPATAFERAAHKLFLRLEFAHALLDHTQLGFTRLNEFGGLQQLGIETFALVAHARQLGLDVFGAAVLVGKGSLRVLALDFQATAHVFLIGHLGQERQRQQAAADQHERSMRASGKRGPVDHRTSDRAPGHRSGRPMAGIAAARTWHTCVQLVVPRAAHAPSDRQISLMSHIAELGIREHENCGMGELQASRQASSRHLAGIWQCDRLTVSYDDTQRIALQLPNRRPRAPQPNRRATPHGHDFYSSDHDRCRSQCSACCVPGCGRCRGRDRRASARS